MCPSHRQTRGARRPCARGPTDTPRPHPCRNMKRPRSPPFRRPHKRSPSSEPEDRASSNSYGTGHSGIQTSVLDTYGHMPRSTLHRKDAPTTRSHAHRWTTHIRMSVCRSANAVPRESSLGQLPDKRTQSPIHRKHARRLCEFNQHSP